MEAGEGIFCLGKVAHQRGHLVAAERIAGFDRRLARGGDREAFQQRLGGGRLPPLGQLSDQVGKQTLGRRPHGNLRDGTNQHGPVAKWLEVEAQLRQEGLMRGKESKCVRLQGKRRGCDLHLPVGSAPPPRAQQALIEHPLVRSVLIDEDEPVCAVRHQVGVLHLAQQPH